MNFQQLEYIIAVDQLKSFSQAAEYCNITQATLSMMIKKLEEELNTVIFDRKTQPIITTDKGFEIILQAKKVLLEKNELHNKAVDELHNIKGKIKLAVIPTIANSLLPKILKPILEKYPDLELSIQELTTENIIQHLKFGKIDMGILSTPLESDKIEEIVLYYEMLLVYGEKSGKKKYMMIEEIKKHKIWLLEEGNCLREQMLKLCTLKEKENGFENLKLEANSFETLLNLIDELGGLTLIPELYYNTLSDKRKAKVSFFHERIPVREVSIVYFRPFAKLRIIKALSVEIQNLITPNLLSNEYKKHKLEIARM